LCSQELSGQGNYHLVGSQKINWHDVLKLSAAFGIKLMPVSIQTWYESALLASAQDGALSFAPYLHMFDTNQSNELDNAHHISQEMTIINLGKLGFSIPTIQSLVFQKYIGYIVKNVRFQ
jgi:hypothetical protein